MTNILIINIAAFALAYSLGFVFEKQLRGFSNFTKEVYNTELKGKLSIKTIKSILF